MIIRLSEPYIWTNLRADLCLKKQSKATNYSKESLSYFINSSMNQEYVYLVLLGINTFFDKDSFFIDSKIKIHTEGNVSKIQTNDIHFSVITRNKKVTD